MILHVDGGSYLSIAFYSKELDHGKGDKQWYDPSGVIDIRRIRPVVNDLVRVSCGLGFMAINILTLHAAEISKGRVVSQPMPYCHPQANPHEGSMNLTMYMVNAPLTGYKTDNSARACIISHLHTIVRILQQLAAANS